MEIKAGIIAEEKYGDIKRYTPIRSTNGTRSTDSINL